MYQCDDVANNFIRAIVVEDKHSFRLPRWHRPRRLARSRIPSVDHSTDRGDTARSLRRSRLPRSNVRAEVVVLRRVPPRRRQATSAPAVFPSPIRPSSPRRPPSHGAADARLRERRRRLRRRHPRDDGGDVPRIIRRRRRRRRSVPQAAAVHLSSGRSLSLRCDRRRPVPSLDGSPCVAS